MNNPDDITTNIKSSNSDGNETATDYIKKGDSFLSSGDLQNALKAYEHSIEINPSFIKGHRKKAMVYFLQKNLDQAITEWQKTWDFEWRK